MKNSQRFSGLIAFWLTLALVVPAGGATSTTPVGAFDALHRMRLVHLDSAGQVIPNTKKKVLITPADLNVSDSLSFPEKLRAHAKVMDHVVQVQKQAHANYLWALKKGETAQIAAAGEDVENNEKAVVIYAFAREKAHALVAQGFKLKDLSGQVCAASSCFPVDAPVAMFFFTGDHEGLAPSLNPHKFKLKAAQRGARATDQPDDSGDDDSSGETCPPGKNCSICINGFNICNFIEFVSGTPLDDITGGYWPKMREAILNNENGEIAQLIRDPGRRLLEILQNARDHLFSPNDNGEIPKILRDPIKCTIGLLWGACDQ